MKDSLKSLSDPKKYHEPISIENQDIVSLKKDVKINAYHSKD